MTVCVNEGLMFYKIKQKPMRNGSDEAYWTKKVVSSNMGEYYQILNKLNKKEKSS